MKVIFLSLLIFSFSVLSDSYCPRGGYRSTQHQFGPRCMYRCHCVDDVQCDYVTGECPGECAAAWMGPGCQYGDIAYQKLVQHISKSDNMIIDGRNAVDGLPITCLEPTAWVRVDLNDIYKISGLIINSNETVSLQGFEVTVGNASSDWSTDFARTCFKHNITELLDTVTHVVCTTEIVGRYLVIKTPDNATGMTLCDVRVYGGRSLAYGRDSSQSSILTDCCGVAAAPRAVDGNDNTNLYSETCTHTVGENSPWWRVNLGSTYSIDRIVLYNRQDCCSDRLSGFSILFAFNDSYTLIYKHPDTTPQEITEVTINSNNKARFVEIGLPDKEWEYLTLCEVYIYGDCSDNQCGWSCESPCFCTGPMEKRNKIDGICPGDCAQNWTGSKCNLCYIEGDYICANICGKCRQGSLCNASAGTCVEGCEPGWWDPFCRSTCGYCKEKTLCTQSDGICSECSMGEWGYFCNNTCPNCTEAKGCNITNGICLEGCRPGSLGVNCDKQCGQCSGDESCDKNTGICMHGCLPGWTNDTCSIVCQLGRFGQNCSQECGHCANDSSCHYVNGTCNDGCSAGYSGPMCNPSLHSETTSTWSSSTLPPTGVLVGGALGAACLSTMIILFAVIVWKRRKRAPETSQIEGTYDQIDTAHVISDNSSEYAKIEEMGLSAMTPRESTYENVLSSERLIPKCEFRDIYKNYVSLDDKTGELRLLSVFKYIGAHALTKTNVTPSASQLAKIINCNGPLTNVIIECGLIHLPVVEPSSRRGDDYIENSNKACFFQATGKMEFTILCDFPTTSEAFWKIALGRKVHLVIIIGQNCIQFKPKARVEIGLIQIECVDITIEKEYLLCNLKVTGIEMETKVRNVQVILSAEESSFRISSDINKTVALLRKRLQLRQGIEVFNTLINCTPAAKEGECFAASLLIIDFMERSSKIDIIGIIEAMRKEKPDAIDTFDTFKVCHDVIYKWIVDEENK